jgi:hypothetical protein
MRRTPVLSILLFSAALALPASARFISRSVKIPVDRAVANVEAWIKEKPGDPQAYYVLGRIHAMAWAYGPDLNLWRPQPLKPPPNSPAATQPLTDDAKDPFNAQLPEFGPYDSVEVRRDAARKEITQEDIAHLKAALVNYKKAVELSPTTGIYELGLAWLIQELGKVAHQLPPDALAPILPTPDAKETRTYNAAIDDLSSSDAAVRDRATKLLTSALPVSTALLLAHKTTDPETQARIDKLLKTSFDLLALDHYRKAYANAIVKDLDAPGGLIRADSQISAEAGEAILDLLTTYADAAKPDELKNVADNLKTLSDKPHAITPIIFSLPSSDHPASQKLENLLNPIARTTFDLAADGIPREYPWLQPTTSLLCWDPFHTGKVPDARTLFGSATWNIPFRNGYEALQLLDDNHDGILSGPELDGLAAWTDKNSNGIAEPGEVQPLASLGIVSLNIRPTTAADGTLMNSHGITFSNGTATPTFDWVTTGTRALSHH